MADQLTWKDVLQGQMPADWAEEIDIFEGQMHLRKQLKIEDKVFAETRLRRGVYGQRYDNGNRHDGIETRRLEFPNDPLTKGPETLWDAPGMMRIKIPFGGLNPEQLEVLAELADEYSDGILHVTTRQDFQLHYVHIEDTADLMRRLAAVNLTTREACGNSVRNITACPLAGICHDEGFDVSPYADAMMYFLLGHDDTQEFGRKFKIAFSGCEQHACGLVKMHDLGLLARTKVIDGQEVRGFTVFVGGGLGTIPYQAKVLAEFATEEEIMPLAQAVSRVFARLGEKKNRNRARIKFLVGDMGIDEFRRLVEEELKVVPPDPRHTDYIADVPKFTYNPPKAASHLNGAARPEGFDEWYATNVYQQRQEGYSAVTVNCPLGDFTTRQAFQLADIARKYVGENMRTTVEQNLLLRFVSNADLPDLYRDLKAIGLGAAGAGTIVDITSCPGTDTCKLGIASSRGLAAELRTRLTVKNATLPDAVKNLKIKVSGCVNSCGQHHAADIGFFGNSRRQGNLKVPHFQVVLGGQWTENAGAFGLAVGAVPSKRIPDVVDLLTDRYVAERQGTESFQDWIKRLGKAEVKAMLEPFTPLPTLEEDGTIYQDWGDTRMFTIGDIGIGECAGEVVSLFSMEIAKAESAHLDALIALDAGDYEEADERAYQSMLLAARALLRAQSVELRNDADSVVDVFRVRFFSEANIFDTNAKSKFGHYLLSRHNNPPERLDADIAKRLVEEAQLFIEATHTVDSALNTVPLN